METSILVEPEAVFTERRAEVIDDMLAFKEADVFIYGQLQTGPQRLTSVLNIAARMLPARSKRHRLAIKHSVLMRLGELIRQGNLQRIRRTLIALPKA